MVEQLQGTIFITKDDKIVIKVGDKYFEGTEQMYKLYEDCKKFDTQDLRELVRVGNPEDYLYFLASHILDTRRVPTEDITSFRDEHYFLSNMYPCSVLLNGVSYMSAESAFQSMKTTDPFYRQGFVRLDGKRAKAYGRKIKLRDDWDDIKLKVMHTVLVSKFSCNPYLLEKLQATGNKYLEEQNLWHDNYWGTCTCPRCVAIPGENHLGKLLMQVRKELNMKEVMTTIPNTDLEL